MSEATAELATRVRISDPKPSHCSGCFCSSGPEVTFIDFDAMVDRGTFVDPNGAMHVVDGMEELHLCETCIAQAAEKLAYKPELHSRQFREIRKLEAAADFHRGIAERDRKENEKLRERVRVLEAEATPKPRRR